MYITCPKCSTNFVIKKDQIGPEGRKTKCSKCQHIWLAKLPTLNSANKEKRIKDPITANKNITTSKKSEENSKKPTKNIVAENKLYNLNDRLLPTIVKQENNHPSSLCIHQWILLLILMLTIILSEVIDFGHFKYNKNFLISDIKVTKLNNDDIVVNCRIQNKTHTSSNVPIIRLRFYDKNHKIIYRSLIENKTTKIEPDESIVLTKEFQIKDVYTLDATLGSKLDFAIRY